MFKNKFLYFTAKGGLISILKKIKVFFAITLLIVAYNVCINIETDYHFDGIIVYAGEMYNGTALYSVNSKREQGIFIDTQSNTDFIDYLGFPDFYNNKLIFTETLSDGIINVNKFENNEFDTIFSVTDHTVYRPTFYDETTILYFTSSYSDRESFILKYDISTSTFDCVLRHTEDYIHPRSNLSVSDEGKILYVLEGRINGSISEPNRIHMLNSLKEDKSQEITKGSSPVWLNNKEFIYIDNHRIKKFNIETQKIEIIKRLNLPQRCTISPDKKYIAVLDNYSVSNGKKTFLTIIPIRGGIPMKIEVPPIRYMTDSITWINFK